MASQYVKTQAFALKGRLFTLTVLKISDCTIEHLLSQIDEAVARAPALFSHAPIVLDFTDIEDVSTDLNALIVALKEKGLLPVAVQTRNQTFSATAACLGLATLNASSAHDREIGVLEHSTDKKDRETFLSASKMRHSPVRSGQQIANKAGDLIITASVSPGAEVLSGGNIHIYGALRGRALAGLSGDCSVRIFCQSLDAELVSIAGFYKLSDELPQHKSPCQIYLKDEQIVVEPL